MLAGYWKGQIDASKVAIYCKYGSEAAAEAKRWSCWSDHLQLSDAHSAGRVWVILSSFHRCHSYTTTIAYELSGTYPYTRHHPDTLSKPNTAETISLRYTTGSGTSVISRSGSGGHEPVSGRPDL